MTVRPRRLSVPPHVAWPALVVLLLLMSVAVSVAAVVAANSDGGADAVEGYYAKAASYDRLAAAQRASDALGWSLAVTAEAGPAPTLRTAVLVVRDGDGAPVEGLAGTVEVTRPQRNAPLLRVPLAPAGPGRYVAAFPFDGAGLYGLALDAGRGTDRYLTTARLTVR